jgi:hypothetical protein
MGLGSDSFSLMDLSGIDFAVLVWRLLLGRDSFNGIDFYRGFRAGSKVFFIISYSSRKGRQGGR